MGVEGEGVKPFNSCIITRKDYKVLSPSETTATLYGCLNGSILGLSARVLIFGLALCIRCNSDSHA